MKKISILTLSVAIISGLGCETAFEPLQESDYNYSIYGYLDLNSNEHWFRVTPVRETLSYGSSTDSLDLSVTLKRESTGVRSKLSGHLFTFFEDGQDTVNFWNYVSRDSVFQQEEYVLTVEGNNGLSSRADVRIPESYPVPVSESFNERSYEGVVTGTEVIKMVVAEITYTFLFFAGFGDPDTIRIKVSQLDKVVTDEQGSFNISFNDRAYINDYFGTGIGQASLRDAYMIIASGNESWPESAGTGSEENALPDAQRNVQDGLGVVAGVAAYKISLEPCYDSNNVPVACPPRKIKPSDLVIAGGQ